MSALSVAEPGPPRVYACECKALAPAHAQQLRIVSVVQRLRGGVPRVGLLDGAPRRTSGGSVRGVQVEASVLAGHVTH